MSTQDTALNRHLAQPSSTGLLFQMKLRAACCVLTLQIHQVSRSKIITSVDMYSSACCPPGLCQSKFTRDQQGTEQKEMHVLQKKRSGGTENGTSCPPLYSDTPHFLLMHLFTPSVLQFLAPTPLCSSPPFFSASCRQHQVQPSLRFLLGTEILLQQVTETLPVRRGLARIKLCHSSSKFMMLPVTIKKPFTPPDEGENRSGQTGEVGGERNALVVKGFYNRVEIVLPTGARHTTLLPQSRAYSAPALS